MIEYNKPLTAHLELVLSLIILIINQKGLATLLTF